MSTQTDFIEKLTIKVKNAPIKTIVFPEGEVPCIVNAAVRLQKDGLVNPILIGNKETVENLLEKAGGSGIPVLEPQADPKAEIYSAVFSEFSGIPESACKRMVIKPLFFATMMVHQLEVHGMVAGIDCPTAEVIAVSELILGLKKGCSRPSSFYILDIPGFEGSEGSRLVFADPAVNPNPSSEELADIAIATAESVTELLGWTPRVALLSFSTKGSAEHEDVDKVTEAVRLIHERAPTLLVDGELQADAALLPETAAKKTGATGPVAGLANVLIFPDLDAANIGSKLVQILAKAGSFGPVLQGFSRPVSDLSRGASADDIFRTALLVAARS